MQKEAENLESFGSPSQGSHSGSLGCSQGGSPNSNQSFAHKGSLSPFLADQNHCDVETSPYKSKFTVLRFSAQDSSGQKPKSLLNLYPTSSKHSEIRPFEISPEKVSFSSMVDAESSCVKNLFQDTKFETDSPYSITDISPTKQNTASAEN